MFAPTVFSLSEVRSRNRASNTIDSYLRSVMVLLLFLDLRKINLEGRLDEGQLLSLGEVEELVGICRLPLEKIHSMLDEAQGLSPQSASSVVSLEKLRMRTAGLPEVEIDPGSAATRLRNIRDYLRWLAIARMSKHGIDASLRITLESSTQYTSHAIDTRLPSASYKSGELDQREGLEPEVVERILKVIDPHSSDNPWTDEHSRYRNALIIEWLLCFGLRRGELLNVRIGDVKFRDSTVMVVRRADNPDDPRKNQPKVKTKGREIPVSSGLLDKTNAYIMNHRSVIRGARKHDFLFVASDTQNVGVYVQATPEIVERIDRAMAMHLAPLAQAFSGVIIADESEATRKGDPTSRICDPRIDPSMKPMGNCGKYGFCGSLSPISCYTCRSFQPWLDGPHEAVLNHLIAERDRLRTASDARIASINDRTILAVAEVVRRCEEIRAEMKEIMDV